MKPRIDHPILKITLLLTLLAGALISTDTEPARMAEGFEVPTIKDTSYPIPPDAYFVSTTGSDANSGTETRPFRTITKAVQEAPPGATIVIFGGTYREAVPEIRKPLTLQPYPHQKVWLKGSIVVTGWVADGAAWRIDGWTHELCKTCVPEDAMDPSHPYAGLPDQVFIDGDPLRQVGDRGELGPGTFFVDEHADQLLIGSNPDGKTVEVSIHIHALKILLGAEGSTIRGIGFSQYAPYASPEQMGMVFCDTKDVTFEDNTFAWSAAKGLVLYHGTNGIVRGNTFLYNGQGGFGAWRSDGLSVERNRAAFNNQEHFIMSGELADAAGAKITRSKDLLIQDNIFDHNLAIGLWLDISVYNASIVRNIAKGNARHGIYFELSSTAIIASNIVTSNDSAGISLSNATDVRVYNNTLSKNATHFRVQDDDRINSNQDEIDLGITWITSDITFVNNLLSVNDGSEESYIWVRDYNSSPLKSAAEMLTVSDFNAFYREDLEYLESLVEWWEGRSRQLYRTLAAYQSDTGRDPNSMIIDGISTNPFFVDEPAGNFALKPGSIAISRGMVLPAEIAEAIGVAGGEPPNLGALLLPGGDPVTPHAPPPADLNLDGKVNTIDVALCANAFLGIETNVTILERADLNLDGRVDVLDVQMVVNAMDG
jgi:parallel beta-helix repeat protein